jgi:hypothetical protein
MRISPKLLFLAFFLAISAFAGAQELRTVQGRILDTSKSPIAKASIMLFYDTPGDTLRTLTGNTGYFIFTQVKNRPFYIKATSIGFGSLVKMSSDTANKVDLGSLALNPSFTTMQEIVISTPPIVIKEDTVEFKADSFKVKPNAMVEDLLKRLPGVSVDKDGNVMAQGKQVTRVKVNGKDFFQGDVKTATRELSADMIDKVQIVDDYGDQSNMTGIRDGEPDKVINLQLKKDKNKGMFGRVTAGAGTDDRYQVSGNMNYFNNNKQLSLIGNTNNINANLFDGNGGGGGNNFSGGGGGGGGGGRGMMGGIQLMQGNSAANQGGDGITTTHSIGTNFRNDFVKSKGSSFYGSYTFTRRMTDIDRTVSTQNLATTNTFTDNRNTNSYNQSNTHRAFLNLEYNIDSFNYIKISPQLSFSETNNQTFADFNTFNEKGLLLQDGFSRDSTLGYTPNLSANILYNHKFRKRGRNFSVNANISTSESQSDRDSYNYTEFYLPVRQTITDQLRNTDNRSTSFNTRLVYTEPIAKDRYMDMSYTIRNSYSKNDSRVFNTETGVPILSPLTNAFENEFIQQRIGANIRTVKKKYNYTLGLVAQPFTQKGYSITKDSVYTPVTRVNVIPVARLAYNFTRTKTMNFSYQGDVQQPSLTQLQPLVDNSNPQNITSGNPNLKPAVTHGLNAFFNNFNFQSGKVLFLGMNASIIQNQITDYTTFGPSGSRFTRPENINGFYQVMGFYNWSKPYQNRRYVFSLNGNLIYNNNPGFIDGEKSISKYTTAMQGVNFEFNHKEWLEFDFGVRYSLTSQSATLQPELENFTQTWGLVSNGRLDFPGGIIFRYDVTHNINIGFAEGIDPNFTILNASLEKTVFKKKNGFIRLSGFDILKQNQAVSRTFGPNSITDSRVNRLTQYFMLAFTYRLQKFTGQQSQGGQQAPRSMERQMRF